MAPHDQEMGANSRLIIAAMQQGLFGQFEQSPAHRFDGAYPHQMEPCAQDARLFRATQ
jgi:hypothetical protein